MMGGIATGKVTGTGAAINISCGFVPRYVKVYNNNDAGSLWATMEWFTGMAAASGLKGIAVAGPDAGATKSQAKVTTNGISEYAGDATHAAGFTIGADADLNASAEDMHYIAFA
jgi:hypothetical protein